MRDLSSRRPLRAGVNALGVGGTNAHVILEEAPAVPPSGLGHPYYLIPLSARSNPGLAKIRLNLARFLQDSLDTNLADLSFSLQTGRRRFEHRFFVVCRTAEDAIAALRVGGERETAPANSTVRDVAFYLPGSGNLPFQSISALFDMVRSFREEISGLCAQLGTSFEHGYTDPIFTFVVLTALAHLWMSWGVQASEYSGDGPGAAVATYLSCPRDLKDASSLLVENASALAASPPDVANPSRILLNLGCGGSQQHANESGRMRLAGLPEAGSPRHAMEHLLTTVGHLWVAGIDINWTELQGGDRRRRIPLPQYPCEADPSLVGSVLMTSAAIRSDPITSVPAFYASTATDLRALLQPAATCCRPVIADLSLGAWKAHSVARQFAAQLEIQLPQAGSSTRDNRRTFAYARMSSEKGVDAEALE